MLFQKKCPPISYSFFVYALLFVAGCKQIPSSADYDLGKPETTLLGNVLNEISGICCFNEKDSSLLSVVDSKERVYRLEMRVPKLADHTEKIVPTNSDLEDIVKVDSSLFLLMSKGILKEVPDKAKDSFGVKTYQLNIPGTNDFETVYYDPTVHSLILLCKSCHHEKGEGIRTAYRFDLATRSFDSSQFYTISKDAIKEILRDANAKFDPSAAAINPINKRLYILSSAGNLLVVTDNRGTVFEAYPLNPDIFPQSEGIAFAPNGDMFISNEKKHGEPTLLRIPYQPGKMKKTAK